MSLIKEIKGCTSYNLSIKTKRTLIRYDSDHPIIKIHKVTKAVKYKSQINRKLYIFSCMCVYKITFLLHNSFRVEEGNLGGFLGVTGSTEFQNTKRLSQHAGCPEQ